MNSVKCYITAILGYLIPLLSILVAVIISGWFNLVNNALSDLGHATRSNVSLIFNLGLSLGSFFIIAFSLTYSLSFNKLMSMLLLISGFFLNLIAIFDEVYGTIHFMVSLAFFTSLAVLIIGYSVIYQSYITSLVALSIGLTSWILHYSYGIPKGAAIPELVSIFVVLPLYMEYVSRVCRK